eukprot:6186010-Pleurochrysis_carterae.AAC.7
MRVHASVLSKRLLLLCNAQELQRRRSTSRVFQGKHGFITPRDLFRWAERKPGTYQARRARARTHARARTRAHARTRARAHALKPAQTHT